MDAVEEPGDRADQDVVNEVESMPNLDPNYEVFMKWPPEPIIWRELYDQFVMKAQIRYADLSRRSLEL